MRYELYAVIAIHVVSAGLSVLFAGKPRSSPATHHDAGWQLLLGLVINAWMVSIAWRLLSVVPS